MFKRFDRLMPLFERNKFQNILYNKSKYNFTPNLPTLSLYGDVMSYLFKKSNNKDINEPDLKIPYEEQWENRDFNIKDKCEVKYNKSLKIPYEKQWEVKDFYIPKKQRYDVVVLNDKTVTYQDYIQQLFLLDKENQEKNKKM